MSAAERVFREEWGRVLATLVGFLGDFDLAEDATTFPDERLELIFTCCHPALAVEAQVALTCARWAG